LQRALEGKLSAEVRNRIKRILDRTKPPEGVVYKPSRVTLMLSLLEELRTPEARRLLAELAESKTDSRVRREARAILERRHDQKDNPGRKLP
jgi:hypothetical protein